MGQWITNNLGLAITVIAFVAAAAAALVTHQSYKSLAAAWRERADERSQKIAAQDAQIKSLSEKQARREKILSVLRRDYGQSLEFNLQDRIVIRRMAFEIRDLRGRLNIPGDDYLVENYAQAIREIEVRRIAAAVDEAHDLSIAPEDDENGTT